MLALQGAAEAAFRRQPRKAKREGMKAVIPHWEGGGPKKKQPSMCVPEKKGNEDQAQRLPVSPSPSLLTVLEFNL